MPAWYRRPALDERAISHELAGLPGAPYPLRAHAERALLVSAAPPSGWQPLGYTAADYVQLLRGICTYFRAHQDARGAILDPYAGEEKQYATPCYAVAAALVALDGRAPAGVWGPARRAASEAPHDMPLLESAARAQDHALHALAVEKTTAQQHSDFYAPLVVLGYQLLAPFVERPRAGRWLAELRSIDPESVYHNTFTFKRKRGQPPEVHNWNVVAIAGELLREKADAGSSREWVQEYLEYQLRSHADLEWGLYRDPSCPLPYDLFPRHHLGYAALAVPGLPETLTSWLERGEWTSALTQTGSGGIPPGWRSSEHLWNDAALVALAECAARRHASAGRPVTAGLFRRVAALAFRSMLHWQRPSGELHVVKNHYEPDVRWGFEGYSFHSNYGLYPAAMLATAVLFGDCETSEAPAPVETGSYVIRYPDAFHKVVAVHEGLTLAFDLDADGKYDVTGLNSVRRLGAHPLLGPATGVPAAPRYTVPEPPGEAIACGLAWRGGSLAASRTSAVAVSHSATADGLEVALSYTLVDGPAVEERVRLIGTGLCGEAAVQGAAGATLRWPFLRTDGRDTGSGRADDDVAAWSLGAARQRLRAEGVTIGERRYAARNGEYVVADAPAADGRIAWRVEYE